MAEGMGEQLKELFQGKKGKYMMFGIGGVVLLGGYAYYKSKSAAASTASLYDAVPTATTTSGTATDASSGGVTSDQVGSLLDQYGNSVDQQLQNQQAQFGQFAGATNAALAAQQQGFQGLFGGLTDKLGNLQKQLQDSLYTRASQQIAVDYHDTTDYNSSHPYAGNAALNAVMPMYGYGGADYNTASADVQQSIVQNEARLASDPSFVQSERQRTAQVIASRQAAGLDTSAQVAYQQHLSTYGGSGGGGGSSSSGSSSSSSGSYSSPSSSNSQTVDGHTNPYYDSGKTVTQAQYDQLSAAVAAGGSGAKAALDQLSGARVAG